MSGFRFLVGHTLSLVSVTTFLCAALLCPQAVNSQDRNEFLRIAAVVYDELIFLRDVDQSLRQANPNVNFDAIEGEELFQIRMRMLGLLIDERLQVRAVERQMTPEMRREAERAASLQVGERMSELRSSLQESDRLSEWQRQQGMTLEQYERFQQRFVYRNYLRTIIAQRIKQNEITAPSEAELNAYRQQNPDFENNVEIRIAQILFEVSEDTPATEEANILRLANQVAERARTGENFAALVNQYSDDEVTRERNGVLRRIKKGELFPEFDVLFDLEPGTVTDPIRTPNGYHVVLILESESLEEMVTRQKLQDVMQQWTLELRNQASEHIDIRLTRDGVESSS